MNGARAMARACKSSDLTQNPAGILACIHALHSRHGRSTAVLMPYADALRPFGQWWAQLWAESLGKRHDRQGKLVEVGSTPLIAVGATDQHAQMQLFMDGPRDKLISFIEVRQARADVTIPARSGPFAYLGGHTMQGLLHAARRATSIALHSDRRPNLTLSVPCITPVTMGELFFLYEAATALAGETYDINAFDQLGVETGKRLTNAILGKPGFDLERDHIATIETQPSRRFHYSSPSSASPQGEKFDKF